ncbi:MAG: DegT/DnrJ/EryC1/StrS family aminotransferase [Fulvivirga sp.]
MSRIYLSPPHMGGQEIGYIQNAFDSNWIAPVGPNLSNFENELQDYFEGNLALALSSGTAAIHIALELLGVKEDDEVICSSFTFAGSCFPIIYQKAKPIFIDSEQKSWNMSAELLEAAIKDRVANGKKPKAIILVHLYGVPPRDFDEILKLSHEFEIPIIEDAAEAAGSSFKGKKLGSFGHLGILSFNGNKIITTSGGGALLSKDQSLIERARYLSTQAKSDRLYYHHTDIGYNYRMSNICAGIGRGQLEVLDNRVTKKRKIFDRYFNAFKSINKLEYQIQSEMSVSNRWLSVFNFNRGPEFRDELIQKLESSNIESRPLWKPMHMQPVFLKYPGYLNGVSENLFNSGICLPSGTTLTKEDQKRIIEIVLNLTSS